MKHIKKKFLNEFPLSADVNQLQEGPFKTHPDTAFFTSDQNTLKDKKLLKKHDVILLTDDNTAITTFQANLNGNIYVIPEADPVLIYFHSAQIMLKQIELSRTDFLKNFSSSSRITHDSIHFFYGFFGNCSTFIVMLFTALEAFVNRKIKNDFEHKIETKDKTETYTSDQFIKKFPLDYKIKHGLVEITKKDFTRSFPLKNQQLIDLKEFRNEIVHTKRQQNRFTAYDYLYRKALNCDFNSKILAVRDFINFYELELIEDCPCNADF